MYGTPVRSSFNPVRPQSTSARHSRTTRHIPIFSDRKSIPKGKYPLGNTTHIRQNSQIDGHSNMYGFDFCGCENRMTVCEIIGEGFLRNVSVATMRHAYEQVTEEVTVRNLAMSGSTYRKAFLKTLPRNYPELLVTHLQNLVQILGEQELGFAEFQCLAAVQYHTKIEYITYYLYNDMKRSHRNKYNFMQKLDNELIMMESSLSKIKYLFSERGMEQALEAFIHDYYSSVGALLVPVPYYAKFMVLLFRKPPTLVKLLARFLVRRRGELEELLRLHKFGELDKYRNYLRGLNFSEFIQELN